MPEVCSKSVWIVGRGGSITAGEGARQVKADEIWSINSMQWVLGHKVFQAPKYRAFWMDDFRELVARDPVLATMIANNSGVRPTYTSTVYPEIPFMTEYPIMDVIAHFGCTYFTCTPAYMIALAVMEGFETIYFEGCDFTIQDEAARMEQRACMEFWAGIAYARGVELSVNSGSKFLSSDRRKRLYGYPTKFQEKLNHG